MNTSSEENSEGLEGLEEIQEKEEIEKDFKEYVSSQKANYLCEPILNSELILFNNSKLLLSKIKKNINPLSINIAHKKRINFIKKDPKTKKMLFEVNGEMFEKIHNKMVFLIAPPKYNDIHLKEIMELRSEYETLDANDSPGLQKVKRDIRNRIRDLSSKTFTYRDKNIFGGMVMVVMNKIITRPNFSGYSYKSEMKSLATEHIFKYTWRFASYKQSKISGQHISSFTYISTIIFNAFIATINKQNDELKKIKLDFLETQKVKHREPNKSSYGKDASTIDKEVNISIINSTLFEEIKKVKIDCKDILIKYSNNYNINMDEYKQISDYIAENNVNISLVRN